MEIRIIAYCHHAKSLHLLLFCFKQRDKEENIMFHAFSPLPFQNSSEWVGLMIPQLTKKPRSRYQGFDWFADSKLRKG